MFNITHIEFKCILKLPQKYMQTLYLCICYTAVDMQMTFKVQPNSASSKKSSLNSPHSTNSLSLLNPAMPSVFLSVIYLPRVASVYDFSPLSGRKLLHLYFASLLIDLLRTYYVPGTVLGAKVRTISDTHAYPQSLVEGERHSSEMTI